jgi:hypothetical protein
VLGSCEVSCVRRVVMKCFLYICSRRGKRRGSCSVLYEMFNMKEGLQLPHPTLTSLLGKRCPCLVIPNHEMLTDQAFCSVVKRGSKESEGGEDVSSGLSGSGDLARKALGILISTRKRGKIYIT